MKNIKMLVVTLLIIMIGTTTVYAYSNNLVKGSKNEFDIHYQNVVSLSDKGNVVLDNENNINFETTLAVPGDYYEFTVDMKNNSVEDATIDEIVKTELTERQQRYLEYTVTYANGETINIGDIIESGETKTIKVRLTYKYDITAEDLPTEDENLDLSLNFVMVQK